MRKELLRTSRRGKRPRTRDTRPALAVACLVVLVAVVVVIYIVTKADRSGRVIIPERHYLPKRQTPTGSTPSPSSGEREKSRLERLIATSRRSLVFVQAPVSSMGTHEGSGFIATTQGHILTNYHVIEDADEIFIRLESGVRKRARILSYQEDDDLAVLKIEGGGFAPLKLGDSRTASVGQQILVMGYPLGSRLGSEFSANQGMISSIRENGEIIQCDVAVNPGNSGGPVLSVERGEVLGIIVAKISEVEDKVVEGIGFCIPINKAKRLLSAAHGGNR